MLAGVGRRECEAALVCAAVRDDAVVGVKGLVDSDVDAELCVWRPLTRLSRVSVGCVVAYVGFVG